MAPGLCEVGEELECVYLKGAARLITFCVSYLAALFGRSSTNVSLTVVFGVTVIQQQKTMVPFCNISNLPNITTYLSVCVFNLCIPYTLHGTELIQQPAR